MDNEFKQNQNQKFIWNSFQDLTPNPNYVLSETLDLKTT